MSVFLCRSLRSGRFLRADRLPRHTIAWVGCALCLVVAGCQPHAPPEAPPLEKPSANVTLSQFAGTALSGELAQSIDTAAAQQAWGVSARVLAVKTLPTADFEGIGPHARLVLSDRSGDLMAPSARLVYSTLYRTFDPSAPLEPLLGDAKTWAEVSQSESAIAPGTTTSILIAQPADQVEQTQRLQIRIEIYRTPGTDGYQLALVSDDRVAPPAVPKLGSTHVKPQPASEVRETVVVQRPAPAGKDRIVLAVPMQFMMSTAAGLVIDLTVDAKPADTAAVATKLKATVDASAARAADRLKQAPASANELLMAASLDGLAAAGDAPRASLVFLAQQAGATLTESVVLVADDKLLALITRAIRAKIPELPRRDPPTVSWMLDKTTIQILASIKDDETGRSLPAVQGALESYAGEAARQLDLLQSLANEATSSEDLLHRLIAEHLINLEDNSPAVRVRAFDWLRAHGGAPAGYDPLANGRSRRDALAKYQDAAATTRP